MPTTEMVAWQRDTTVIEMWESGTDQRLTTEDAELQAEVARAQTILALKPDWDGEDSLPYSKSTLDRAVAYLNAQSKYAHEKCGLGISIPKISPGPDGSIDLYWKRDDFELLVNVPADANLNPVFYGDNYGVNKISGSLDLETVNLGLVTWLMM